ncbi:hypothetical protein MD588_11565 [Photobacterium sp. SDRW27]|uniref:DUF7661 family protein n=1 Tax=Photobacterium obscurum TaxID=2829490 RepID=UPI0022448E73|nr:hypothetical protein [Photobacterium obscurum]MCW8329446.1 hypothetical protein [Photobacterium obscurum]
MFIKFDVFGKLMSVQRKNEEWLLFMESDTSMRVRIYDVAIPAELDESELAGYLADIFHENVQSPHLIVERLAP